MGTMSKKIGRIKIKIIDISFFMHTYLKVCRYIKWGNHFYWNKKVRAYQKQYV